jgi:hypothetical protein
MLFAHAFGDFLFMVLLFSVVFIGWLIYSLVVFVAGLFKSKDQKQQAALESLKLHRDFLFEERREKTMELKEINDEIAVVELQIEEAEYEQ